MIRTLLCAYVYPQPTCQKFFKRRKVHLFVLKTLNLINIPVSTSAHTPWMKIRVSASLYQLAKVDRVLLLNHYIFLFLIIGSFTMGKALSCMLNKFIIFMYHKTF